jgi:hypothetical protein
MSQTLKYSNIWLECKRHQRILCFVSFQILVGVTMENVVFWVITQCSSSEIHRRFGGTYLLITCFLPVLLLVYFSTVKAILSSETSVNFYQTFHRYSPECRTLLAVNYFRLFLSVIRKNAIMWISWYSSTSASIFLNNNTSNRRRPLPSKFFPIPHPFSYHPTLNSLDTNNVVK